MNEILMQIAPRKVTVAFQYLTLSNHIELGPITPVMEPADGSFGRKLTSAELRARDAALAVITEYFNSDEPALPLPPPLPPNPLFAYLAGIKPPVEPPPAPPSPGPGPTEPQKPTSPTVDAPADQPKPAETPPAKPEEFPVLPNGEHP